MRTPSLPVLAIALFLATGAVRAGEPAAPPPAAAPTAAAAPTPDPAHGPSIAITTFKVSEGVDPGIAAQVSARVAQVLSEVHHAHVITPDEIAAMLQHETEKQAVGCEEDSCLAEVAGALGADHVIAGRITKIDQGLSVSMSKLDAKTAQVITRLTEVWGGPALQVVELAAAMADRLQHADATGSLEVVGAVLDSKVLVDGQLRAGVPAVPVDGLQVGAHRVQIIHDDMQPTDVWVVIRMGQVQSLPAAQVALEVPVWKTWWFWTATVGGLAVVGGAVGTGVYFATAGSGAGGETGVRLSFSAGDAFVGGR